MVVKAAPSLQTPTAAEQDERQDDLTAIKQIGPFLQDQLNQVDIYRYEQIAGWSEADITTYTELIGYLPGMIERDDWVGQARRLADADQRETPAHPAQPAQASGAVIMPSKLNSLPPDPASRTAAGLVEGQPAATPPTPDPALDGNLRLVEGIGPRISQLLYENGITNLGELAATSGEDLKGMLDDAGGSFRLHSPETWPAQAALAAKGKYEELRTWQDDLKGGL